MKSTRIFRCNFVPMSESRFRTQQHIPWIALAIYLVFVFLKFETTFLLAVNAVENEIDLVDWNDDRLVEDKELTTENTAFKSSFEFTDSESNTLVFKPDFFYNPIYKEIKLNIVTPPPKI